jgi:hypothetical protein
MFSEKFGMLAILVFSASNIRHFRRNPEKPERFRSFQNPISKQQQKSPKTCLLKQITLFLNFQVQSYKDDLIKKAEELITYGFPKKIVELNELLETSKFAKRDFHDVYQVIAQGSLDFHTIIETVDFSGFKHPSPRSSAIEPRRRGWRL